MIEELIIIGKLIFVTLIYVITFYLCIKLHDHLKIRKIRREMRDE